jgi:hypothetical protein
VQDGSREEDEQLVEVEGGARRSTEKRTNKRRERPRSKGRRRVRIPVSFGGNDELCSFKYSDVDLMTSIVVT